MDHIQALNEVMERLMNMNFHYVWNW